MRYFTGLLALLVPGAGCGSSSHASDAGGGVDSGVDVDAGSEPDATVACVPGEARCSRDRTVVETCRPDGGGFITQPCNVGGGELCDQGRCVNGCDAEVNPGSNAGCLFYAVDLDNASISLDQDASAQQFGVVVASQLDVDSVVTVEIDGAEPGQPSSVEVIEEIALDAGALHVFDGLPRREVDGTPEGHHDYEGDTPGTHLSSAAFRIRSDHPIVAYQLNPLQNEAALSNDASLLLPVAALGQDYTVIGWPQTIADTDDPYTDFGDDLRSFVTIVGTAEDTTLSVTVAADTVVGDNVPGLLAGVTEEVTLGAFDVLNLETGGFNADLTGTLIHADRPVAVFSGSEASEVPYFPSIAERLCCADHLEEQLTPDVGLGRTFHLATMPRRTPAVAAAGGTVAIAEEPEYFRVIAVEPGTTTVETTLEGPITALTFDGARTTLEPTFALEERGFVTLEVFGDFSLTADKRVSVGQFVASQQAAGIPNGLPGGDPAFFHVVPVEQYRPSYRFLVPDGYAFDFVVVIAPLSATVELDDAPLPPDCAINPLDGDGEALVYECPLSSPVLEAPAGGGPWTLLDGRQRDGIHLLEASAPVALFVYGFDSFVSYGFVGGTGLDPVE